MSKVLITGVTGQDGSYLAERLVAEGHEVWGLVKPADSAADAVMSFAPGLRILEADLTSHKDVARVIETVCPEELFHLAGISSVALSWQEPVATGEVTGLAAVALIDAALSKNAACRVLLASSAEVFAGTRGGLIDESSPISPINPYGAAKAYAHLMARVWREQGAFVSTATLFNHESPRRPQTFVTRRISAAAARVARGLQSEIVLGNTAVRRDWGWAPDYVDAMVRAVRHSEADEFVVATGVTHTVADFAKAALIAAGVDDPESKVVVDAALFRSGDAPELRGDSTRARSVLGWEPTLSFADIVSAMVFADLALLDAA